MEVEDVSRNSASSLSWFEFLLNEKLLEEHLSKVNPDPSPTELIIQFLASAQNRQSNGMSNLLSGAVENKDELELVAENKNGVEKNKTKALRLLALKVAAFLNWNLTVFEDKLPLPVQYVLLCELLKVAVGGDKCTDVKYHLGLNYSELSDQALFAIQIYHCWIIRAVMLGIFPTKPPKTITVPVPGQQIFSFIPVDNVLKIIHEACTDSKTILENLRNMDKDIMMPSMASFEIPTETRKEINHVWSAGTLVPAVEIKSQICYDLGCIYFFHEDYPNAGEMFFNVKDLMAKVKGDFKFCCVNKDRLRGYLKACSNVLKKPIEGVEVSLEEKLQLIISNNYEGLFPLLMLDNEKMEISSSYRYSLERSIHSESLQDPTKTNLYLEIAICNVVRTVLEGKANTGKFFQTLSSVDKEVTKLLLKVVHSAFEKATEEQKNRLKLFICYLCGNGNEYMFTLMPEYDIEKYFSAMELNDLLPVKTETSEPDIDLNIKRDFSGNIQLQIGGFERDLIQSYDPLEIKQVIHQLYALNARKPLWKINSMWELPNTLNNYIPNILTGFSQDFVYILTAKSRELTKLKNFNQSRHLLDVAEREMDDVSFLLSKLIRWEALLVDMLQFQSVPPIRVDFNLDLSKKCKACILALHQDKDVLPRPEIIEHCAAYLLSIQQWEYLATCDSGRSSRLEFACVLGKVCIEIRANSGSRKAVKELWELVLPIFSSNSSQQKRSAGGMTSVLQREAPHAIFSRTALNQFMEKVQNVVPLSIMVSCLAKLHNILKDDSNNNIFLEYPTPWPSVVSNSGAFYIKAICESLTSLLNRVLQLHPNYPPFLKTMADLNYVLGYHAKCLKYYLEAGIVSSDFFNQPIPKTVFDDQVYKRMIRCCSQLTYHTQAAVLCQFLDEVDYMTAFKSLQEKNCSDAMDAYYNCFWDVTILEFLVNLHTKRGEIDKKQLVLKVMGQVELNSSNSEEVKREASLLRKKKFLRALTEQCL